MKARKTVGWLLITMMFLAFAIPSAEAASLPNGANSGSKEIQILLDGKVIQSDVPPYILPAVYVTMVPLRVISEELGAKVIWNEQDQQVVIVGKENTYMIMKKGSKTAMVNGQEIPLDASVELKNSRMMVPLRFVSEQLGLKVEWNQELRRITLTTQNIAPKPPDQGGVDENNDQTEKAELRGVWISTVYNLDWPSQSSYGNATKQMDEYRKLLDELQALGMNAVFVQVRAAADAIYPSRLVPWATSLTGTQGRDPGYDPLALMIEETHKRDMEFHAWFNPFRASVDAKLEKLSSDHIAKQQPDWIVNASNKLYINPGVPQARQHIIDSIIEVVQNYKVDGVHLDDYFYPSNVSFADDAAYKAFNSEQFRTKADWRRNNINVFVRDLGQAINAVNPEVSYGISPFGVWRNQATDATGSETKAGVTAYDSMFADVRTWIKQGWVDYINPQIYWSLSFPAARYDKLVDWWAQEVQGTGVDLYIGHSPYKLGTKEAGWDSAQELINQLHYNKQYPQISGDVFFSAKDLMRNPLNIKEALQTYYMN
ncbi:family 10 glycosylhydrolase [Paenibacillus sp. CAU 1782]